MPSRAVPCLIALATLAGCTMPLPPGSQRLVVNTAYDHLGSCFARHAEEQARWSEPVSMERYSDINEIRVTSDAQILWSTPQPTWEVQFHGLDDQHTEIIAKGVIVRGGYRDDFNRFMSQCGSDARLT